MLPDLAKMAPRHGGDLDAMRQCFRGAPEPWIDLSTGINPWPYPVPEMPAEAWHRLPGQAAERAVRDAAAGHYGVPADTMVLAPGSQALIQWLPRLRARSRVAILGPTYGEHAWCWSAAGHNVQTVYGEDAVPEAADVVIVVRPNNPDGRILPLSWLAGQAATLSRRGGWLIVDEAFADAVGDPSVFQALSEPSLVVLRSFGKFFGLAGSRLGIALVSGNFRTLMQAALGPWCVSGPALAVAERAFADAAWIAATRAHLSAAASRLDEIVLGAGLRLIGGTTLFRLYESERTPEQFDGLARAGIFVRRFAEHPSWLRFGLPASAAAETRLAAALTTGR